MILENPEKHLTDQEFFTHIKFFNFIFKVFEIPDAEDGFKTSDLTIGSEESYNIFHRIFKTAQILEIGIKIIDDELDEDEIKKELQEKTPKEQESLNKIIKKIKEGKGIKIQEVADVSWVWFEVYRNMRFMPDGYQIPQEIKDLLILEINKYLDNFINNKLAIARKNYYRFETQKRVFIKLIEDGQNIALYGNNFVIQERIDENCISRSFPDFCLIHTVFALQKLGYLKVMDLWQDLKYPKEGSDKARYVNVNIILEESFIDEINSSYKKENPKNIFESFDKKRGNLKFAGQDIGLSKKGKETDAVLLLDTLLKEKTSSWKHNDEILDDWGYNDEDRKDLPKNKVYFAAQKINTAVAIKTKIEDFIECNTTKARVNPKYRKIDE